jgi:sulfoxide reductase heme-binding subunit YedZ
MGSRHNLGANPVETITHYTGDWGLRFLLITLMITPFRYFTGWNWPQQFRRMLGLFAFFYVFLHFITFLVFDHFFNIKTILEDIVKRPYITVGCSNVNLGMKYLEDFILMVHYGHFV